MGGKAAQNRGDPDGEVGGLGWGQFGDSHGLQLCLASTRHPQGARGEQCRVAARAVLTGSASCREALLAEMGVAMREDGGTLGVFSPKKVGSSNSPC